ncbi:AI-2E family transporter [Agromyces seonyuensis]|uniref:AI-2E family transporter n=1 Tax=Agromyces seonyuensis TaxID=2662446 RepID=A0A6I4P1H8_9MICO|nr:AI-2E family transporter [Agromyces seonyuensis]MWB99392.1 AI-2E family transporter [Agromyces seonyuensis]
MSPLRRRAGRRTAGPPRPQPAVTVAAGPDDQPGRQPEVRVHAFRIGFIGTIGVLLALVLGGIVSQLGTVILYVVFALFIALGLDPIVSKLQSKFGMPRWAGILTVFGAILVVIGILVATIAPILVEQITYLVNNWRTIVSNVEHSDFVVWLLGVGEQVGFDGDAAVDQIVAWVTDPANIASLGGGVLAVGAGIAGGVTGAIIVLILSLYFLASLGSFLHYAARFVPRTSRPKFNEVTGEVTGSVGRYVIGQASLGAVNGVLSLIFLSIIGAPAPILLAFIAFLASLVPLVGTLTGAIIISLVCLAASPLTALVSAIYYLVYMQVEAYFISPRIMTRAVAVPGALVVVAAVAGAALGGVLGALVAIPVAASLIIVVEKVVFPRQEQE